MNTGKWSGNRNSGNYGQKVANNAVCQDNSESESNVMLSAKQFEQLLKLFPVQKEDNSDLESPFSRMTSCNKVDTTVTGSTVDTWLMDSGATDHMNATLRLLTNVKEVSSRQTINTY